MSYLLHILTMIGIYTILGLSLNLALGYGGILTLCHAAFYGIGAYAFTLLVVSAEVPFLAALPAAVLITSLIAYLVSLAALRLKGDFFVLATLGFQVITFAVLINWVDLTRGPYGIEGIPSPVVAGLRFQGPGANLLLVLLFAFAVWFVLSRILRHPFGRTLKAIRDDEIAAQSLGKNTVKFKRIAVAAAGGFAAIAGALFAGYASFIDPTSFTLDESVFILCVVIIGGAGNLKGPLIGAVVLVVIPEMLRFVGMPDAVAATLRQIIYGLLIILMMRFRPQGIAGEYAFD